MPPSNPHDQEPHTLPSFDGDCAGFIFRYFAAGPLGNRIETKPTESDLDAENIIITRINQVLTDRFDLLTQLCCLENGVEIRLHQGHGFHDEADEVYFFGRTTVHGDDAILEFATDEVLYGGGENHGDVMDVIVHELMHLLDYLDDDDGILPGWNSKQRKQFEQARAEEWAKLQTGQPTPLVTYALTNDVEFLAVLAEAYWTREAELLASSPVLHQIMDDYFHPKKNC